MLLSLLWKYNYNLSLAALELGTRQIQMDFFVKINSETKDNKCLKIEYHFINLMVT